MDKSISKLIGFLVLASVYAGCHSIKEDRDEEYVIYSPGVRSALRVWEQKEFVLSTFNGVPEDTTKYLSALTKIKEANFNYIETAWLKSENTQAILRICDQLKGLKVIAQDLDQLGGFARWTYIPYERDSLLNFLQKYGKHSSLGGVYVFDEPYHEHFSIVKKNTDELELLRPDLLGFTVILQSYSPWYNWENSAVMSFSDYVEKYIEETTPPILCSDYYPFQEDLTDSLFWESDFWKDMAFLRKKVIEHGLIHWFYYQAQAVNGTNINLREEHLKLQFWIAIMYGVKGVSSFTACPAVIDEQGSYGSFFQVTKKLNSQIKALGNTLLSLHSAAIYHGNSNINDPYANALNESVFLEELPHRISVGEFVDVENNHYFLILNNSLQENCNEPLLLKTNFRIYLCDPDNGGWQRVLIEKSDRISLSLNPAEAMLVRIEDTAKPARLIKYLIN